MLYAWVFSSGLDFVAHEDILPYSITEVPPLEHELFDKLFTPDPINGEYNHIRSWVLKILKF